MHKSLLVLVSIGFALSIAGCGAEKFTAVAADSDASTLDSSTPDGQASQDGSIDDSSPDSSPDSGADALTDPQPDSQVSPEAGLCDNGPLGVGTFRDLGLVPAPDRPKALLVVGSEVLVGTSQGLYRRPLDGSSDWALAGFKGKVVSVLAKDPHDPQRVYAGLGMSPNAPLTEPPFQVSNDGGHNFAPFGREFLIIDSDPDSNTDDIYSPISDIAVSYDGSQQVIFANGLTHSVAASTDNGLTFRFLRSQPTPGSYSCLLTAEEEPPLMLYQACTAVVGNSWITRSVYALEQLGTPVSIVDDNPLNNRIPSMLTTSPNAPGLVYAGLQGQLLELQPDGTKTALIDLPVTDPTGAPPYIPMTVWVDPCDSRHVASGGHALGSSHNFQFIETYDHGGTLLRIEPPAFLSNENQYIIEKGATTGVQDKDFVLLISGMTVGAGSFVSSHVVLWEHTRSLNP